MKKAMIDLTVDNGIAWLTLNRPEVLNAMDLESVRAFRARLEGIRDREDVRVVVTGGAGRAFCAGSDLKDLAPLSAREAADAEKEHADAFAMLEAIPQPTVAMLHGHVLGGGVVMAMYHDFRIASSSARLGMPEVELGWTPPWGMGRLVDVVGGSAARWIALGCETVTGEEAKAFGLVHDCVADDALRDRVRSFALRLASFPPAALRETRALLNRISAARDPGWDDAASEAFEACFGTDEARANVAAFIARKKDR